MSKFRDIKTLQKFSAAHASIQNHFNLDRHLICRADFKKKPHRSVGGFNLIPVAVARHIRQTMPVSGSFIGDATALEGLEVTVTVEQAAL